ncbi:MAG: helix-turn-helix transcriptional regulator [Rhodospirillaceae bacterium]|jgi:ArsR family transcriptional regulator, virulence genes transcriptional regulator|nr:helix-turn-helix transcriptional regulator [Rhodospirillaceae bacterium]MBT4939997.1 helix-turn-helix transcriptional regulator [Rhodospirillaceae bacterium]MBT5940261.1 helix-turn-helix transcriptional regulator [Rhodospirillaceae bacterium]MBT7267161.1 helix-turn-helix transcriptional regulator [Rhodospirillaceae bacterium]
MDIKAMEETAADVSDLLKVLANERRLLILCQLVGGEMSVGEIARNLGLRDATTSQQLSLLRKDGLVTTRREAQTIYYSLIRDDVRQLMEFIYTQFCGTAKKHSSN